MRRVGIDIGSRTIKLVVMESEGAVSSLVRDTTHDPLTVCGELVEEAKADRIVATGYGRHLFSSRFPCSVVTEIKAFARGASALFPGCRTILDIGGQDMKVIALDGDGRMVKFEMNDRCAAGTGRFLEMMALALQYSFKEFAVQAMRADDPVTVNSTCAVFAESEVVGLVSRGVDRRNVAAGIHQAIARRVLGMMKRVSTASPIVFAGGVAADPCLVRLLEEALGTFLIAPENPHIVGAYGAALLA